VRIPAGLLVHTATIRPKLGESSTGTLFGSTFTVDCLAEGKRRLVRGPSGDTVLSDLTLYTAPGQADAIPVGSEVTALGRTSTVLVAIDHDSGGLGAPDHTEVSCG
jgi:hypothetical protein